MTALTNLLIADFCWKNFILIFDLDRPTRFLYYIINSHGYKIFSPLFVLKPQKGGASMAQEGFKRKLTAIL